MVCNPGTLNVPPLPLLNPPPAVYSPNVVAPPLPPA
jgi:hypothetical protein